MDKNTACRYLACAFCLALLAGLGVGCKGGKDEPLATDLEFSDPDDGGMEETTSDGLPQLDQERLLFDPSSSSGLKHVYFDYDSSSLRPDTLSILRENAELIKKAKGVVVQIEGHCDERGTQEYNLALSERRALGVRAHLMQLGVSGDRLITISYGEEFPASLGHNETAWAKNRRAEFNKARSL